MPFALAKYVDCILGNARPIGEFGLCDASVFDQTSQMPFKHIHHRSRRGGFGLLTKNINPKINNVK